MKLENILDEALEAWAYTREGVVSELKVVPERDLDFRPAPTSRTVRQLAQHVLESGLLMAGELTRPDGDFCRQPYAAFLKEYGRGVASRRTKRQLVDALRTSREEGDARIRRFGEVGMLQQIQRFDGEQGTRLAWMNHAISHEEYHRGQLALYVRLLGRMPALTRLITGG